MTTKEKLYHSFSAVVETYDALSSIANYFIGETFSVLSQRDKNIVGILDNRGFIEIKDDRVVDRPRF